MAQRVAPWPNPFMSRPASVCFSLTCGHATPQPTVLCPQCGKPMRSARQVSVLGWVGLVIGVGLVVGMGLIAWQLAPSMLLHPGVRDASGSRFTGAAAQGRQAMSLFAWVMGFGALGALSGAWQVITGRRSRVLLAIVLVALAGLGVSVWLTFQAFDG